MKSGPPIKAAPVVRQGSQSCEALEARPVITSRSGEEPLANESSPLSSTIMPFSGVVVFFVPAVAGLGVTSNVEDFSTDCPLLRANPGKPGDAELRGFRIRAMQPCARSKARRAARGRNLAAFLFTAPERRRRDCFIKLKKGELKTKKGRGW